jgi:protein transport protein SEC61 subunit gamma-like protein
MEVADIAIAPLKEFMKDSVRLLKKCTKPDRREFTLIASKTAFGK